MIQTVDLTKTFPGKRGRRIDALKGITLRCDDGEIYALLGPNGAGKTTLLRILSTIMTPTSGTALVGNLSVTSHKRDIRRLLGVVSFETQIYERMTPREIAYFFGRMNDLPDAEIGRNLDYVVALLNMESIVDRRTDQFSTGMKQKTVIMRALITDPKILIFDEPTSGLDLLTAKSVTDYLKLLREEEKTVLFSTHILREAEQIADRIGIIHEGVLVAEGDLDSLTRDTGSGDLENVFFRLIQPARRAIAAA